MATVYLFPGQGSQKVGMGVSLVERFDIARQTFEQASEVLGFDLLALCTNGPEDQLRATQNAQPALLTHAIAALRVMQQHGDAKPDYLAGHSLGEYSALVAAGALDLEDAIRLVRIRGEAMIKAVPIGQGAMAALIGVTQAQAQEFCDSVEGVVVPANLNGSGQVVISGEKVAVEMAMMAATEAGVRRVMPLPVSGPFHSPLMQPAADTMAQALEIVRIKPLHTPIIANVTAQVVREPNEVKQLLIQQVVGAVQWEQTMAILVEQGVTEAIEFGPGNVLSGLMRRSQKSVATSNYGEADDFGPEFK